MRNFRFWTGRCSFFEKKCHFFTQKEHPTSQKNEILYENLKTYLPFGILKFIISTPNFTKILTHKKIVLHFLLIERFKLRTSLSCILKFQKNKGPKTNHFHFTFFHFFTFTSQLTFAESYLVPRCRR